jgi:gas vesicle protein
MADHDDLPYIVIERRSAGLAPFLWGAAIGAGLALLFAPRSGRELRRELGEGVQRLRSAAEDTVRQLQDSVSGTIEDLREEVSSRLDSARRAMEAGRRAAHAARADLERRIREAEHGAVASARPIADSESIDELLTEIDSFENDEFSS